MTLSCQKPKHRKKLFSWLLRLAYGDDYNFFWYFDLVEVMKLVMPGWLDYITLPWSVALPLMFTELAFFRFDYYVSLKI